MGSGMFDASRYEMEAVIMSILEGSLIFGCSSLDSVQPKPPASLKSLEVLP